MRRKPDVNKIWKFRKDNNLSQKELASLLGVKNSSQICRWEKGRTLPDTKSLLKLSAVFHRLPNDIFQSLYERTREEISMKRKSFQSRRS